jgi:hypothetical protein
MNASEAPDDLERELAARNRLEPDSDFRRRVLTAVRAELRGSVVSGGRARFGWLAGAAAAVFLAMNFSMSVASDSDFRLAPRANREALVTTAAHLRRLSPELSEEEALRHALVLSAGTDRTAVPLWHAPPTGLLDKEQR